MSKEDLWRSIQLEGNERVYKGNKMISSHIIVKSW